MIPTTVPTTFALQGLVSPILLRLHGFGLGAITILALVILVLQVLAIISVVTGRLSLMAKVLWILAIVFLNIIGVILYFLLGRTRR